VKKKSGWKKLRRKTRPQKNLRTRKKEKDFQKKLGGKITYHSDRGVAQGERGKESKREKIPLRGGNEQRRGSLQVQTEQMSSEKKFSDRRERQRMQGINGKKTYGIRRERQTKEKKWVEKVGVKSPVPHETPGNRRH